MSGTKINKLNHKPQLNSFIECLQQQVHHQPDQKAYTFLGDDGKKIDGSLTYSQLDLRARSVATWLQQRCAPGDRVLLLYPPGLEYIAGFFGCLYAGVIAVPAYPPEPTRLNRTLPRLQAIVSDARADIALTTTPILGMVQMFQEQPEFVALNSSNSAHNLSSITWAATDIIEDDLADDWNPVTADGDTLAFLQYTSGSTGSPKGVMVSHGNLLNNSNLIGRSFEFTDNVEGVIWLPIYHDMGLIGGVLQPLYHGFHCTLMSPLTFLQWPMRWLNAISNIKDKSIFSGGPNFAFDLCVRRTTPAKREVLDLSNWQLAFTGAEPVRAETIDRFSQAFGPCGFKKERFYPCYGLAEATLYVSGGLKSQEPIIHEIDRDSLKLGHVTQASTDDQDVQYLVGSGHVRADQSLLIVNSDTMTRCQDGEIGEIWLAGQSVTQGYWNNPQETAVTFGAYLSDTKEGPFLRTGDVGYMNEGELFVTGRLKDLIIIRGRNYYPQDIELTVERCHKTLRPGSNAAFSVDIDGEEQLIVVQEVKPRKNVDLNEVIGAIRHTVSEVHNLMAHTIVLIQPRTIQKTSSGKIRRRATRAEFVEDQLEIVQKWSRSSAITGNQQIARDSKKLTADVRKTTAIPSKTELKSETSQASAAIEAWLITHIAELLQANSSEISSSQPFASFGLDSAQMVSLTGDLQAWLGRNLSPTLAWEHPTITALARHLAGQSDQISTISVSETSPVDDADPIAVIGLGCRFPGADSPDSFWQLLRDGVDAINEVPAQRWDIEAYYDKSPATTGKMNTRWGGFLDRIDEFDAAFFGIAPKEAVHLDPQQRLLLEVAWEALEQAGQTAEALAGSQTGTFIGISSSEYAQRQIGDPAAMNLYAGTGNALSVAANRLSYWLDLRGPSLAIDTACSSSLVGVHYACQSLRNGESNLALAGGVNLMLAPDLTVAFSQAGVMAADGRCKTFDAKADGYVRSEGCGVVILKRLSDAQRDGDRVLAVIRGSAVNQDGRSNGLTAPNGASQQSVIRQALDDAKVAPAQIDYVEAHGTGTPLGDPIEVGAIQAVLGQGRADDQACLIGSVKTNIGHLEAAAGIAGLIKTVLALHHREIPPQLHFNDLNPHISLDDTPFDVATKLTSFSTDNAALAGVSSFGFGGTNAHVILEAVPPASTEAPAAEAANSIHVLPISAHTPEALTILAQDYQSRIADLMNKTDIHLYDVCYTASARRSHHDNRLALVASTSEEMLAQLEIFLQGEMRPGISSGQKRPNRSPKVVFVFPGQGAQWLGMGRELLEQEPVFKQTIEACDQALGQYTNWSLIDQLMADQADSRFDEVDVIQPTLFSIQVALAALWRTWGIEPDAVIGQSMGEVAAACVAGVLSLTDAARIICRRSQLVKSMSGRGGMAVVGLSMAETQQILADYTDHISVAVSSSPTSTVISGDATLLQQLADNLTQQDIFCRLINVDYASHSQFMDALQGDILAALNDIQPQEASVPIYSTVTGELNDGLSMNADYWWRNLREPVLFSDTVQHLLSDTHDVFIEISPHPVISSAIQQGIEHHNLTASVLPSLRREENERSVMLSSLGALYASGYAVDWSRIYQQAGKPVSLPMYPWQRERFWWDANPASLPLHSNSPSKHPLLGQHIQSAIEPGTHYWEIALDIARYPFLNDHCIQGIPVLPASTYLEVGLAAAKEAFGLKAHASYMQKVVFHQALFLSAEMSTCLQLVIAEIDDETAQVKWFSREVSKNQAAPWTLHAEAMLQFNQLDQPELKIAQDLPRVVQDRCAETLPGVTYYQSIEAQGVQYGGSLQGVDQLWWQEGEALGRIKQPSVTSTNGYWISPALLDSCFQLAVATLPANNGHSDSTGSFVPVGVDQLLVQDHPISGNWGHAVLRSQSEANGNGQPHVLKCDVALMDDEGHVVLEAQGLHFQHLASDRLPQKPVNLDTWLHEKQWELQTDANQTSVPVEDTPQTWLIFGDGAGLGQRLKSQLEAQDHRCFMVSQGDTYQHLDALQIQLNPTDITHIRRLLADITPDHLVHLWSLADEAEAFTEVGDALKAAQQLSCGSVLHLVQALTESDMPTPPRLWLVTRQTQVINATSQRNTIGQSSLWGLGRVIAHEHPELRTTLVDLGAVDAQEAEALCQLLRRNDSEDQIMLLGQDCYVARLKQLPTITQSDARAFSPDGTYLITGGCGGIGLYIAEWMVQQGVTNLVLMGRSGASEAAQVAIDRMQSEGAKIKVAQADVSVNAQVAEVLEIIRESMPPLKGILHAAGVAGYGLLSDLNLSQFDKVMAPKLQGAWNLHQLTLEDSLDCFVLFSSTMSLIGAPGMGNYAAANACLDSLAFYRQSQDLPALSINWGPWSDVGLAAQLDDLGRLAFQGMETISPEQGVTILARLLQQNVAQVGVMPMNWTQWHEYFPLASQSPMLAHLIEAKAEAIDQSSQPLSREALLAEIPEARYQWLVTQLGQHIARILGYGEASLSRLDVNQPLNSLGIDSLMAVQLKNRVEADLGVTIPIVTLLQGPSVVQLVDNILDQLVNELADETEQQPAISVEDIDDLSDEEVEALLQDMLTN